MTDDNEKLLQLQQRLDKMAEYQEYFYREISLIRNEIDALKQSSRPSPYISPYQQNVSPPIAPQVEQPKIVESEVKTYAAPGYRKIETTPQNSHLEEFIGKNIISLIGIIITIIGVGIGAKYAIDKNLISPAMRIFLGDVFAFGLLGFAFKLKTNYEKFSAVLLSGAVAILYFLTFFAYSFYDLISQTTAFAAMVVITILTVFSALSYNRQVIAVIGLVGAYAVPFLLSDGSGRADILFSYISIINVGILAVSVLKYWKFLYFSAFGLSWLIFIAWFADQYTFKEHFALGFIFATVFFTIFYAASVAYNLYHKEKFSSGTIVLLLANSLIYFVLGLLLLDGSPQTRNLFGLFTIANAVVHFGISYLVSERLKSRQPLYFTLGLALFFVTIAVPMQLEGFWTPIFWTIEAVFLFWVGFAKRINFYEIASYILMILATCGIFIYLSGNQVDWSNYYYNPSLDSILTLTPLFNLPFLTSSIFVAGFGIICYLINLKKYESCFDVEVFKVLKIAVSLIFLVALYNIFRAEIGNYWHLQYVKTAFTEPTQYAGITENRLVFDNDLSIFNVVWQINYSMLFLTILSFVNINRLKNVGFGFTLLTLNAFVLCIFAVIGLYFISELRESYLLQTNAEHFIRGSSHLIIRYISLAFAAALVFASYRHYKQDFLQKVSDVRAIFEMVFAIAFWIILSSELINLMSIFGYDDSYRLALSLLWGSYSVVLIGLGILWRKSHLRIGAIVLFALTLVKLFFYDIASLSTISKTIVFVSLGVMLLIISFLYNKYKDLIFQE